jgi:hypothetical protein
MLYKKQAVWPRMLLATCPCHRHPCHRRHPWYCHHCRLTDIDCMAPVHPRIRCPHNASPSCMLSPSNHPLKTHLLVQKKSLSDTASYSIPCSLTLQYRVNILRSIIFYFALYNFSLCNISQIPYTILCSNISLMISVTEVTLVRYWKVWFTSLCVFSNGWQSATAISDP